MDQIQITDTEALRADRRDRRIFSSAREIEPPADLIGLVAAARRRGTAAFYWERPESALAIAATGNAWSATAAGAGRFGTVAAALHRLRAEVVFAGDCDWLQSPIALASFSFADEIADCDAWRGFAAARLVLPELCVVRRGDRAALLHSFAIDRLVGTSPVGPVEVLAAALAGPQVDRRAAAIVSRQAHPAAEAWTAAVEDTVSAIRRGDFDKLVMARSCRLRGDAAFDLEATLRHLAAAEPGCTTFSFSGGDADFVGATPETLVSLSGGELRTFALAGTTPRGANAERDRHLRTALQASGKDRREHDLVVRGMRADLGDLVHSLSVDERAEVVALHRVQHLRTALRGRVAPHRGILDIAAALHPSPAVGGYPKRRATAEIAARESFERGCYAAPLGWCSLDGDGELAVGLRCGVLRGNDAWLFAGAGIVANSDPRAEFLETELKLQPMLAALGASCAP